MAFWTAISWCFLLVIITVNMVNSYSIGTPGQVWGVTERITWRDSRKIKRSYPDEVGAKILALNDRFDVASYGSLSQDSKKYLMYSVKTRNWDDSKPCVLITGGVHGYETSGIQGALLFLDTKAEFYSEHFNILVAPCVSPWGYETIQRWNCQAVDPNRSFNPDGEDVEGRPLKMDTATEESSALISLLKELGVEKWACHLDLHETTDTDATEFSPTTAARDGILDPPPEVIPDGFYLVADSTKSQSGWYTSMIESVRKVTHIAPTGDDGKIIGEDVIQEGVIAIPSPASLGLCAGVTNAEFATTTEVYPDSPNATGDICNRHKSLVLMGPCNICWARGPRPKHRAMRQSTPPPLCSEGVTKDYNPNFNLLVK